RGANRAVLRARDAARRGHRNAAPLSGGRRSLERDRRGRCDRARANSGQLGPRAPDHRSSAPRPRGADALAGGAVAASAPLTTLERARWVGRLAEERVKLAERLSEMRGERPELIRPARVEAGVGGGGLARERRQSGDRLVDARPLQRALVAVV